MKKLTKIRLINWHYFGNETIIVKNNILLTGQNATGKSTILDALTYVITAGDTQFNLAANEKGKRDLRGYVKCKIGADDRQYLREGDVTAHVSLQFYDEAKESYFTVGVVIDCVGDVLPAKSLFYSTNQAMDDSFFISDGFPLSIADFKKKNKDFEIFPTKKEAKKYFKLIFGSLNDDFFKLIPKALAFKPIGDVKEFIYQHLLEEKQIDLDNIRDSIRSYKQLELTLNIIKEKILALKKIEEQTKEIDGTKERLNFLEYMFKLFEEKAVAVNVERQETKIIKLEQDLNTKSDEIERCVTQNNELVEQSRELHRILANNEEFAHAEYVDTQITKSKSIQLNLNNKYQDYLEHLSYVKKLIQSILETENIEFLKKLNNMHLKTVSKDSITDSRIKIGEYTNDLINYLNDLNRAIGKLEFRKRETLEKISNVTEKLKSLEKRTLSYSKDVIMLKHELQEGLKKQYNTDVTVYVLCELLEVTDSKWKDTVEVFLGNKRFNLIVEPRYYDAALQIYNRVKTVKQIYGVGVVNTKRITTYNDCTPGSMASIITSENVDAKRYINMTVGNVILCDDVKDLEKYSSSITSDGMVYQGFTVRSLNYNAVPKPFIGSSALEEQKEQTALVANKCREEFQEITKEISELSILASSASKIDLKYLENNLHIHSDLISINETVEDFVRQKENLSQNSSKEMQANYQNILKRIKEIEEFKLSLVEERGALTNKIAMAKTEVQELIESKEAIIQQLGVYKLENLELENQAEEEFKNNMNASKDVSKHMNNYSTRLSKEKFNLQNLTDSVSAIQLKYNEKYNTDHALGLDSLDIYLSELYQLEKTEIISYEQKVRSARESAELLFKEDFLSKLRNYIMSAEDEIKKINETLQTFQFGEDKYEFVFPKSKEFSIFYDMVTEDLDSINDGFFNIEFEQKYNDQLEELFATLAIDEENSNGAINKFTDYRTYMDYDIRIENLDGENVYYSKVAKEKSGGETQVPFYVAILASFVRIYHKKTVNLNNSIGLVMFDEVFDKMDSRRMQSMMGFIQTLPIQIILACPPQRMEILKEFTDTQIITVRDNKSAQIISVVEKGE